VQVEGLGGGGQSLVYCGHEYLSEWGGDGDTSVIFRICTVAFSFVQWNDFGCSPRGRWCLINCAIIQECG
jgi:hypothetical protein